MLYTEVFSPDSKTAHFNRAVDQVRKDQRCTDLLGDGHKIKAYGEPTWNKWARARPIAYVMDALHSGIVTDTKKRSGIHKDGSGTEHLIMHFNVRVHMPTLDTPSLTET